MIYVASPYSSPDPQVVDFRHRAAQACAYYITERERKVAFSPIVHSHSIAKRFGVSKGFGYWRAQDFGVLERCDEIRVLRINGWEESVGVKAEMEFAREHGIAIVLQDWAPIVHWLEERGLRD